MRWRTLAGLLSVSGCNVVAGLGDFVDAVPAGGASAEGGGGATTSGPSGGAGGEGVGPGGFGGSGGATVPAVDWTGSFDAVYRFEDARALGLDSSGMGHDLTTSDKATFDDSTAQEGTASLALDGGGLSSTDSVFASRPFTFGVWLSRTGMAASGTEAPIARFDVANSIGYRLHRGGAGRMNCAHGNGNDIEQAQSHATHLVDDATWVHVVCRATTGQMELLWNGTLDANATTSPAAGMFTDPPFEVGSSDTPWPGNVDEVFFVHASLTDGQVARIHAAASTGPRAPATPTLPRRT
jgi:hypothetical protein